MGPHTGGETRLAERRPSIGHDVLITPLNDTIVVMYARLAAFPIYAQSSDSLLDRTEIIRIHVFDFGLPLATIKGSIGIHSVFGMNRETITASNGDVQNVANIWGTINSFVSKPIFDKYVIAKNAVTKPRSSLRLLSRRSAFAFGPGNHAINTRALPRACQIIAC
jgi:hypothetical protein